MELHKLQGIVQEALDNLFAYDASLLGSGASEWSVAHRLAVYLEALLPGWNVDCEFNRQGTSMEPKTREGGGRVRPDIIVHHRGQGEKPHNLLAVEIKTTKTAPGRDGEKSCEYTRPPKGERRFQYSYGLTIALYEGCSTTWFENGGEITS